MPVCAIPPVDQARTKIGWGAGRFTALPTERQSAYRYFFSDPDRWRIEQATDEDHFGLDFVADAGSPVVSPSIGVVVAKGLDPFAEWRPSYGHWIVIQYGEKPVLFAHLRDASALEVGASVATGDLVGYVGNSGLSSNARPRLYLAVRPGPCVTGTSCYEPAFFALFNENPATFFASLGIDLVGSRPQPLPDYASTPPFGQQLVIRAGGPSDPAVCGSRPLSGYIASSTQSPIYRRFGQSSLTDTSPYRPGGAGGASVPSSGSSSALPLLAIGAVAVWLFVRRSP